MKRITFDFRVSDRYKFYIREDGKVFKLDTRKNVISECGYNIAHGYKRIRVTDIDTGKRRYLRVHRLVAIYFIDNPNNYDQVNHIDGDKLNNHVSNLEWCNLSMNIIHAYENDLIKDRGGWKSTPYEQRIKRYGNTESNNI